MICPECGNEAMIQRGKFVVKGANFPDTDTKLYYVMDFTCRNRGCGKFGETIGEKQVEQEFSET